MLQPVPAARRRATIRSSWLWPAINRPFSKATSTIGGLQHGSTLKPHMLCLQGAEGKPREAPRFMAEPLQLTDACSEASAPAEDIVVIWDLRDWNLHRWQLLVAPAWESLKDMKRVCG